MKCNYCGRKMSSESEHSCRTKRKVGHIPELIETISNLIDSGNSVLNIANNSQALFGMKLDHSIIRRICKNNQIRTPSTSETRLSPVTKKLYADSLTRKYGAGIVNISQAAEVKQKKLQTNQSRYGVENQFQRPVIKEKAKETLFKKYGVYHPIHLETRHHHTGRLSIPHQKVSEYLTSVGIIHLNDKPGLFRKYNESLGREYCPIPDIYIPDKNAVIEIYGDYWHMNPARFFPSDVVKGFKGFRTAQETWNRDHARRLHILSFGVKILVIWESEIKKDFSEVKQKIRGMLCND